MKHVKKFQVNEEYGIVTDTFSVAELREKLMDANGSNNVVIHLERDGQYPLTANVTGVSQVRVDKNRYQFVIHCEKTGMGE